MATTRRIRLPRSAPETPGAYLKLLYRVDGQRPRDWKGIVFAPGITVPESQLRPGVDFPERPILLECAGHRYILWELGPDDTWVKLASTEAAGDEWARTLYRAAHRALKDQGLGRVPASKDLNRLAQKFQRFLEKQLEPLEPRQRVSYLGVLRQIIERISARLLNFPTTEE